MGGLKFVSCISQSIDHTIMTLPPAYHCLIIMKHSHATITPPQVIVGAGTICVFHVGGYQDAAPDGGSNAGPLPVPRWEFFIGDAPHAPLVNGAGRRQPMVQIADADRNAVSGMARACCLGYRVLDLYLT